MYTPTLTGLGERAHLLSRDVGLDTHIRDIVGVLEYEELRDVILVGHSYAGMVIAGVADRVPARLAHLVYLDAFVPRDGQAVHDIFSPEFAAHLQIPALSGVHRRHRCRFFHPRCRVSREQWRSRMRLPCAVAAETWRLTEGGHPMIDALFRAVRVLPTFDDRLPPVSRNGVGRSALPAARRRKAVGDDQQCVLPLRKCRIQISEYRQDPRYPTHTWSFNRAPHTQMVSVPMVILLEIASA